MTVSAENLTHHYGERVALSEVSFEVREGEIFGVLGPNGGGKSTLFHILSTMLTPVSGRARVAGFDVVRQAGQVRRRIGVVFQAQSLDRKLTVAENLRAQGNLFGLYGRGLAERTEEVLARLGLADRRNDAAGALSGGLRQRLEIAKALLHRPAVLLMDEPSTGLDPGARLELWRYIQELRDEQGVTVLLTTHILEEADRADRLLLLHKGKTVAEGAPAELKARIGGDVVVLDVAQPERMREAVERRMRVRATTANGALRIEIGNGHRFIAEVVEAFPGEIQSVALHKPTLEDVFLDETGARIE
ncbi:MAG TPA: ATP-binding cassette domain-containing protein [Bryobacteraceae bacterium]|nr:ATP-binding cassette domain-containing protein [Bryobacteraceae bacterium]